MVIFIDLSSFDEANENGFMESGFSSSQLITYGDSSDEKAVEFVLGKNVQFKVFLLQERIT
ncbi:hypothetical protein [Psychrobacillus sp. OK028]|uniref:hypothetical protein n=1 Tax=Psychrobacillus sp. OK028 TaxID=1884359 RepID=UPI000B83B5DC|nr:hypothetical protein [Psychrobacillus sp. OK028]